MKSKTPIHLLRMGAGGEARVRGEAAMAHVSFLAGTPIRITAVDDSDIYGELVREFECLPLLYEYTDNTWPFKREELTHE